MNHAFWILFVACSAVQVSAQGINSGQIKGLRVNGEGRNRFPVARLESNPVTIEFDIDKNQPDDFRIRFYHCDKNWNRTQNSFVNDEMRNSTKFPIPYEPAPAGVQRYRFHYTVRLPGFAGVEKFVYSGNYAFEVWDRDETAVQAEGRFFVAEDRFPISLAIKNRLLPSQGAPMNQVNKIVVPVNVEEQGQDITDRLIASNVRTLDIYKNREFSRRYRIDTDDRTPNTFIDGFGTANMKFSVDNIQPGNEYRRLDLTNTDYYPPNVLLKMRGGADVSRMFRQGPPDLDGQSILRTENRYSDYLSFQFELDRESDDLSPIYVVGDFNSWQPGDAWKMTYDQEGQRYILRTELRRGTYDYQYVCNGDDWTKVEGNDWRTVNQFTALLYYHDIRYGGFDRIIGMEQRSSSGAKGATSK